MKNVTLDLCSLTRTARIVPLTRPQTVTPCVVKIFPKPGGEDRQQWRCTECEGKQKNAPVLGLTFIKGMRRNGLAYENGTILDPRDLLHFARGPDQHDEATHASIGYKPPAPEVFVPTFVALARLLSNLVRHDRPGRCRRHSPVFLWCVDKNSKSLRFQRVSDHWALVRIDVGRSRVRLPLVGALSYGLLHPWTCRSSHRRSSWWCLLPSASGLTEDGISAYGY